MSIRIRSVTKNDAPSIGLLSNQLGYSSDLNDITKRLESILSNKDNCLFVSDLNGAVVGWIHGFYTQRVILDPFVEIGGLVVNTAHRNLGIGRLLMETVYNWAKKKNCLNIRLRSNIIRTESHKFYTRLGFTSNKRQKIFYKHLT